MQPIEKTIDFLRNNIDIVFQLGKDRDSWCRGLLKVEKTMGWTFDSYSYHWIGSNNEEQLRGAEKEVLYQLEINKNRLCG